MTPESISAKGHSSTLATFDIPRNPFMSKTYAQLAREIESLKANAEALKRQEIPDVVAKIKAAIEVYGLTAKDLGLDVVRRGEKRGYPKAVKTSVTTSAIPGAAKFRDNAGNTWVGRGPRPDWLKKALAAGRSLESFAVGNGVPDTVPVAKQPAGGKKRSGAAQASTPKPTPVAKYADGVGHSWSGRGPMPGWLKDALAGGKTLQDLTV